MQVVELMHTRLRNALGEIHVTRLRSLFAAVGGLLLGQQLWLSSVGRRLATKVAEKHRIKRLDRLLGNVQLGLERLRFYRWLSSLMLSPGSQPCVLVDWSDIDTTKSLFLLRAAVSVGGRALTVYATVYGRYANRQDMEKFLETLAQVLPENCRPVIVTDAGFKSPWFRSVAARGWSYVGREREPWLLVSNLPPRRHTAKRVVALYRQRMTTEQAFRDLKAYRHGFALRGNL